MVQTSNCDQLGQALNCDQLGQVWALTSGLDLNTKFDIKRKLDIKTKYYPAFNQIVSKITIRHIIYLMLNLDSTYESLRAYSPIHPYLIELDTISTLMLNILADSGMILLDTLLLDLAKQKHQLPSFDWSRLINNPEPFDRYELMALAPEFYFQAMKAYELLVESQKIKTKTHKHYIFISLNTT